MQLTKTIGLAAAAAATLALTGCQSGPKQLTRTWDGVIDEAIAERVGMTGQMIEEMYHVMAIATDEDRFVIPTSHREISEDAYDVRGSCGFSFGNGCSEGETETNLFGARRTRTVQTPTDIFKERV